LAAIEKGHNVNMGREVVHKIANIVLEITNTLSFLIDLAVERDHFVFHSRRHDPRVWGQKAAYPASYEVLLVTLSDDCGTVKPSVLQTLLMILIWSHGLPN
jgi:hypothetical protein